MELIRDLSINPSDTRLFDPCVFYSLHKYASFFFMYACISCYYLARPSVINEDSSDLIKVTSIGDISKTSLAAVTLGWVDGSVPTMLAEVSDVEGSAKSSTQK